MELELNRVDYTVVAITNKNCLKLLPSSVPNEPQWVAVADSEGILQVFSIKKDDINLHFKTLPGPAITALKTGTLNDSIYVASGSEVKGYTKKGKLFLTFDSGMTENITSMFLLGNELFLCGRHIFNHYRECKDVGFYLCGDVIVDVVALYTQHTGRLISLIACEGRMIRALEHARVTASMEVDSSPTVLHIFQDEDNKTVLFGTVDGRIGILAIENFQGFQRWLITNEKNPSQISCINSHDLTGDGKKQLIVGKQDGNIEVYNVNLNDELDTSSLIFLQNCNESISAIDCGVISSQGFAEILVATYSGRIFSLTTHVGTETSFDGQTRNYIFSTDTSQKVNKLKSEIDGLQGRLAKEREHYQSSTQSFFDELSAIPLLPVNFSFLLFRDTSTYNLILEVPTAIDNLLLQCNTKLELLDVENNSAVVSYSEIDTKEESYLLATYRCQININRFELKIRTFEGQKGTLQIYISPITQPKCCRLVQFPIKTLSLHFRIYKFDEDRPYNNVSIKGPFSLAEIHTWLSHCLPEVPEKMDMSQKNILWFQSSMWGTVLECRYQKGEAEFKSDNVSTIAVLKEFIIIEATKKKIKIEVKAYINDETINHLIKLIEPILLKTQQFYKDMDLLNALNELEVNEEDKSRYLSAKYKVLLEKEKDLKEHYNRNHLFLDRLYDAITDLYVDFNKLKGTNVKHKKENILEILNNYSYDKLVMVFRPDYFSH